jgi:pilus assembly protein CpaC
VKSLIASSEHKSAHQAWHAGSLIAAVAILIVTASAVCPAQNTPAPTIASAVPNALGSVSRAASDGKTLHVMVGHSIFVDTKTRLRRVYVADPTVLNSVTLTPNEIIVTAMNPGISSLTLLDEVGQAQSYVVSADLDIDGLRAAMAQEMHGSDAIKIEGSGGRVTLTGTVASGEISDAAAKLAGLYAKEVVNALTVAQVHPKQVRLEVRILEVDRYKALQLGINLFNPGGNTSFLASTTTSQYPSASTLGGTSVAGQVATLTTSSPLSFLLYSAKLNLGATIQDLQTKQVLQILAEPTITTISGQKADFLSGGEFPFPMVEPGGSGGQPVVSISFRPYGVKVEFTPVVNPDGTIRLKVMPEVSALDYSNSVSIGGVTVPALSTRRADTEVELRSNQSFAISGLLDQRTTDIMDKNPGAASIPILGYLFKSKNTNHSTTELIVVVTPTVVDPLTENTEPSQPDLPIKTLDPGAFDKSLGKDLNPQPAAPPIIPDKPPMGNQVPPAPPATNPAAQNTDPAEAPQGTPVHDASPAQSPVPAAAAPSKAAGATAPIDAAPAAVPATAPAMPSIAAPTAMAADVPASAQLSNVAGQSARTRNGQAGEIVEVMALSHELDAEAMVAALNRHGYNVAVNHEAKDSLLHLDVGPFGSTRDAEAMRERLLLDGYNPTIK